MSAPSLPGWRTLPSGVTDPLLSGGGPPYQLVEPLQGVGRDGTPHWELGNVSWEIRGDSPCCALGQNLGGYGAPLFYVGFNYQWAVCELGNWMGTPLLCWVDRT